MLIHPLLRATDQLGTAFSLVRVDINGNIQRLADRAAKDPEHLYRLFALVQACESVQGLLLSLL